LVWTQHGKMPHRIYDCLLMLMFEKDMVKNFEVIIGQPGTKSLEHLRIRELEHDIEQRAQVILKRLACGSYLDLYCLVGSPQKRKLLRTFGKNTDGSISII